MFSQYGKDNKATVAATVAPLTLVELIKEIDILATKLEKATKPLSQEDITLARTLFKRCDDSREGSVIKDHLTTLIVAASNMATKNNPHRSAEIKESIKTTDEDVNKSIQDLKNINIQYLTGKLVSEQPGPRK